MAITIDWGTRVISVPKSYLTLISGSSYKLDTEQFFRDVRDLEDNEEGMPHPKVIRHSTVVELSGIQYARVIEIINGYTVTFEETVPSYVVSLSGSNNNIIDVTNLNSTQIQSNNSAGLINVTEVQQGAFNNAVWIDQTNGSVGTAYPKGTPVDPVNNISDAKIVAEARGFRTIKLIGNLVLEDTDNISGYIIQGLNAYQNHVTLTAAATIDDCDFIDVNVQGAVDGACIFRNCVVHDILLFQGFMIQCAIYGTITLGGGIQGNFLDCYSGIAGGSTPTIDFGGSGQSLAIRNYSGGVLLTNKTANDPVSIDMSSGQVKLDLSTISNCEIIVRGNATVYDTTDTDTPLTHGIIGNNVYIDNYASTGLIQQQMWQALNLDTNNPPSDKLLTEGSFLALK